jgi:cardiolipin synthase C
MAVRVVTRSCVALLIATMLTAACGRLPSVDHRAPAVAFDPAPTTLARVIVPMVEAHPELTGVYPLLDARDAFAARILFAQAAERTLDVRYYIWRRDISGTWLLEALRSAADRGVRVRLLLDDNHTSEIDPLLEALGAHPNIQVRLFNPFINRAHRWIDYVTDFSRLNRRMHNKSFTADNQATIVGGRNIGDEYFGATSGVLFADLDVVAIGPVVNQVASDFERYWESGSSYPASALMPIANETQIADVITAASRAERESASVEYMSAIRSSAFVRDWNDGHLEPVWAATRLVSDDPIKGLGLAAPNALLFQTVKQVIGASTARVDVVSPYFVPTRVGVDILEGLAKRGVKVTVLTNALEANDVAIVHAGYAKWRRELLQNGVTLYELRRVSADFSTEARARLSGSSGSSLHAKTFSVDRARVFVGSFNFDPRSADLNTEMGLVIESPALARMIEAVMAARVPLAAYEVRLSESGELQWIERRQDGSVTHDVEPGTSAWQRAEIRLLSTLPVEWLL